MDEIKQLAEEFRSCQKLLTAIGGREPAASDGRDDADEQMQGRPGRGDHRADPPVPACPTGKNEQHPLPVQLWLYGLFACRKMNGLMVLEDLRC